MRARQQLQATHSNPPPRNVPLINMSSSGESDSDSEKENQCNESLHTANTIKPPLKSSSYNSRVPQPFSQKPINSLQFSTLSLDEGSVGDFDNQLRMLKGENRELQKENEDLKRENAKLKGEMRSMEERASRQEMDGEYEYQLQQLSAQVEQWKAKCKRLQEEMRRLEKQYENRLINQELPSKKTISDENSRIYKELAEKIKEICSKFIERLTQEKMNSKVEGLITDHVNQLLQLSPNPHPPHSPINRFTQHALQASSTTFPSRSSKLTHTIKQDSDLNISSDYRLLQKSIEKLKAMEKEIDARTPPPLGRKQREDSSLLYRSSALDQSSISALDKSKSKRKRIFQ